MEELVLLSRRPLPPRHHREVTFVGPHDTNPSPFLSLLQNKSIHLTNTSLHLFLTADDGDICDLLETLLHLKVTVL